MKTYEELKGMTAEDLVRYAIELQEKVDDSEKQKNYWYNEWLSKQNKFEALKESICALSKLA